MFGDLNRAEIIGNITNDLQVRYTGSGTAVLSFGVATNRRYRSQGDDEWKDDTTFHNVVVWARQAESLAQRARKGTRVYISGRLQTRTWDDSDGKKNYKTEIVSDNIILLDRYKRGSMAKSGSGDTSAMDSIEDTQVTPEAKTKTKPTKSKSSKKDNSVIDPDDLPF